MAYWYLRRDQMIFFSQVEGRYSVLLKINFNPLAAHQPVPYSQQQPANQLILIGYIFILFSKVESVLQLYSAPIILCSTQRTTVQE